MFKRVVSWTLIVMMASLSFINGEFSVYASGGLNIGTANITDIEFQKIHHNYEVVGGNLVIKGENLSELAIEFAMEGSLEPNQIEKLPTSTPFSLRYNLDETQAKSFSGEIRINNYTFDLETTTYPTLSKSDKVAVNQDNNETITFDGSSLSSINDPDIKAKFGMGNIYTLIDSLPSLVLTDDKMTFQPKASSELGNQNISISKEFNSKNVHIKINDFYSNIFKIIETLDVEPITMFPNVGNKGSIITLASNSFNDSINYQVYFLDNEDSDFDLKAENKSPLVKLSGDKKTLAVTVPTSEKIKLGTKRLVIVNEKNGDIVSRYDLIDRFNLIDASYSPIITIVNPKQGSDEGANVQIKGKNIIKPVVPELNSSLGRIEIDNVTSANGNRDMIVNYNINGLTYKGQSVSSLERIISTTIGNKTFNQVDNNGKIKYRQDGSDDYLFLKTDQVFDAETDPLKDVVIEIKTTITLQDGTIFVFKQKALKEDGYTFIMSSIKPKIESVAPDKIQINSGKTLKHDSQISIQGKNFFVDKYTDESGTVHVNYPLVTFQLATTLGTADAVVVFNKNDQTGSAKGTIKDATGVLNGVPVEITVFDENNEIIDGSVGHNLGTRILLDIPEQVNVGASGKKNVQVINTKRSSSDLGLGDVAVDVLDFIITDDSPVIESVSPEIVIADSEEIITIIGSNIKDGVKVYVDGIDVGEVTREISSQGDSVSITFKAPVGKVGRSMIQVVNPSGGSATRDFYYVESYNQDPSITSVSPKKGTTDTYVTVSGDNFIKSNAGVDNTEGLNGYKLLGTRVYLDGKDVNDYNISDGQIAYVPYTAPVNNQPLLRAADNRVYVSPFYENADIISEDEGMVVDVIVNSSGHPQFYDGNDVLYEFVNENGTIYATDSANHKHTVIVADDSVTINSSPAKKYNVIMNNALIRADYNFNRELSVKLSNYGQSVVLYDKVNTDYYTLQKQVDGTLKLSDGENSVFVISADGTTLADPKLMAVDKASNKYPVKTNATGLVIEKPTPITLTMLTPFKYNSSTGEITGNRVEVVSKDKIRIRVPSLASSTGNKDVMVVNPDTKSATLKDGFYYYKLPATDPVISYIQPNIGAVNGGYVVRVSGKDFNEGLNIYFDGKLVAQSDVAVARDGKSLEVVVPACAYDISERYGINSLAVPVVIVNTDGGSTALKDGFTYVKPSSTPEIKEVRLPDGSASGGEIVEILGKDFRFFEPYENLGGGTIYDVGIDTYTNKNGHLNLPSTWDNLLSDPRYKDNIDLWEQKPMPDGKKYYGYDYYYDSPILPKVYFGTSRAKIVDFGEGYIKVISPKHKAGSTLVSVVNNDAGISNTVQYEYIESKPIIKYINPAVGRRTGNEHRDIIGSGYQKAKINTYINDDPSTPVIDPDVSALVRFGNITNEKVAIGQDNDGRINANRATVHLAGGLTVSFDGANDAITMSIEESGVIYRRTFSGYKEGDVYLPAGMLKKGDKYYKPASYKIDDSQYNKENDYELIKVHIDERNRRLIVGRGYSPKAQTKEAGLITVRTPAYHTIDTVPVTITMPDGGQATATFEYLNPSSEPSILEVKPMRIVAPNSSENSTDEEQRFVEGSIQGGIGIKIIGYDFRQNVKVYFDTVEAEVVTLERDSDTQKCTLTVKVPAVAESYVNKKLQIIVRNEDGGIAVSTDTTRLVEDKRLIFFVYRKPLSLPKIEAVEPNKTSQFGGNTITIKGSDFRPGSKVIVGSVDGKPITPSEIDNLGHYIKFVMPKGSKFGLKDVQVVNEDFGTTTIPGALTIISYPEINSKIVDKDGKRIRKVNMTGNDVIKLTGKNFQSGAVVIFGGERTEYAKEAEGVKGHYKDDKIYTITGGVKATNVEFVDENTLLVTTPFIKEEKEISITILNPDTGISDSNQKIIYGTPIPPAPKLKVDTVDNKYFRLYDFETQDTKYYEIFAYIGNKSKTSLIKNKYRDFKSLGTAASSPHKISNLKGLDDLKHGKKVYFVVKAINQYGSSKYSNIVYLSAKSLKSFVAADSVDHDGELGVGPTKVFDKSIHGKSGTIMFTNSRVRGNTNIDLRGTSYQKMTNFSVKLPDTMMPYSGQLTTVRTDFIDVSFRPVALYNATFAKLNTSADEYAKLKVDYGENPSTSSVLSRLPWGTKSVSPVIAFNHTFENGKASQSIGTLSDPISAVVHTKSAKVITKGGEYNIYFYDKVSSDWRVIPASYNSTSGDVTFMVPSEGYIVLTVQY